MRTRWGVLISGNGSTLQALIDCMSSSGAGCDVACVIASNSKAYGIARARRAGIPVEILPAEFKGAAQRAAAEAWMIERLEKYNVQKVFLLGYMRIVSKEFVEKFRGRLFNIHPSLLPKYKGLDAFAEAIKAGEKTAGVTIHEVEADVDSGATIVQREIDIPVHRDHGLSHLLLHINEQRLIRETLRRIQWRGRCFEASKLDSVEALNASR